MVFNPRTPVQICHIYYQCRSECMDYVSVCLHTRGICEETFCRWVEGVVEKRTTIPVLYGWTTTAANQIQYKVFMKPFSHQQMSLGAVQKPSLQPQTASNAEAQKKPGEEPGSKGWPVPLLLPRSFTSVSLSEHLSPRTLPQEYLT